PPPSLALVAPPSGRRIGGEGVVTTTPPAPHPRTLSPTEGDGDYQEPNDHTCTAPIMSAAASQRPPALNAKAASQSLNCPPRPLPSSLTSLPSARLQIRTSVSRPQLARCLPSGWKVRSVSPLRWPGDSSRTFLPVSGSTRKTLPLSPSHSPPRPRASSLPSGL